MVVYRCLFSISRIADETFLKLPSVSGKMLMSLVHVWCVMDSNSVTGVHKCQETYKFKGAKRVKVELPGTLDPT